MVLLTIFFLAPLAHNLSQKNPLWSAPAPKVGALGPDFSVQWARKSERETSIVFSVHAKQFHFSVFLGGGHFPPKSAFHNEASSQKAALDRPVRVLGVSKVFPPSLRKPSKGLSMH